MKNKRLASSIDTRTSARQRIFAYLAARGIPRHTCFEILGELTNIAITEGNDMTYDRIFAAYALGLHRSYGFGPKRILKALHAVDDIFIAVKDNKIFWDQVMDDLRNETGFVVHTNEKDRIWFEYMGDDVRKAMKENPDKDDTIEKENTAAEELSPAAEEVI